MPIVIWFMLILIWQMLIVIYIMLIVIWLMLILIWIMLIFRTSEGLWWKSAYAKFFWIFLKLRTSEIRTTENRISQGPAVIKKLEDLWLYAFPAICWVVPRVLWTFRTSKLISNNKMTPFNFQWLLISDWMKEVLCRRSKFQLQQRMMVQLRNTR